MALNAYISTPKFAKQGALKGGTLNKAAAKPKADAAKPAPKNTPAADSFDAPVPRDAASGLPTGKRMHKPMTVARDPASGQATGKRSHSPVRASASAEPAPAPAPAASSAEKTAPRDAASGLATGRRQHLPLNLTMELG